MHTHAHSHTYTYPHVHACARSHICMQAHMCMCICRGQQQAGYKPKRPQAIVSGGVRARCLLCSKSNERLLFPCGTGEATALQTGCGVNVLRACARGPAVASDRAQGGRTGQRAPPPVRSSSREEREGPPPACPRPLRGAGTGCASQGGTR